MVGGYRVAPRVVGVVGAGLIALSASAAPRPVVAIFDVEDRGAQLSPQRLDSLAHLISARLSEGGRFEVVPRSEVRSALRTQKLESFKECYDERCQIEVGKELAAQKTLATRITRFGKQCLVSVQLFDLKKSTAEAARTEKGACEEEAILKSLERALQALAAPARLSFQPGPLRAPGSATPIASSADLKVRGQSFEQVDIAALELYDQAAKADANREIPTAKKIELWKRVEMEAPKFAAQAAARIRVWEAFAKADASHAQFRAQRKADWTKLKRLLALSVIPRKDKIAWIAAFLDVYGATPKANPFVTQAALKPFMEDAELALLERRVLKEPSKRQRRAMINAFLRRYPKSKAGARLQRDQLRAVY